MFQRRVGGEDKRHFWLREHEDGRLHEFLLEMPECIQRLGWQGAACPPGVLLRQLCQFPRDAGVTMNELREVVAQFCKTTDLFHRLGRCKVLDCLRLLLSEPDTASADHVPEVLN